MEERRKLLSNVIKLPHPVGGIRIEHSLGSVHTALADEPELIEEQIVQADARSSKSYAPLVDEYQRGVEAGNAEAEARFKTEYDKLIAAERARVDGLMASIGHEFSQLHARWEQRVLKFALAVAKAIVKREVSIDHEIVLAQVRESLRHLIGVEKVKLRVNPKDEELLRQHRSAISSAADSLREMVIEADEKIEAGGCILESDLGNVDARLSTQIDQLEAMVLDQSHEESHP